MKKIISTFLLSGFIGVACSQVSITPTAPTSTSRTKTASAPPAVEEKSRIAYEYLTLTAFVDKDGELTLMQKDNDKERDIAIRSIKEQVSSASSEDERNELMKQYEMISSGVYTLDMKLSDLGRRGYELLSTTYIPLEGANQVKLFFGRVKPVK